MARVLNKKVSGIPAGAVYIGRPSKFGNPFAMKSEAQRDDVCDRYRAWLLAQPKLVAAARSELAGKDLVCWCAPRRCHGDTLLEIANTQPEGATNGQE